MPSLSVQCQCPQNNFRGTFPLKKTVAALLTVSGMMYKFSREANMGIRYSVLGLLALWGCFGVAQATPLQLVFTPSSKTVNVGDNFLVDFKITGLNPNEPSDIISAFDVDVLFDSTLLSITAISFGTQLGVGINQGSGFDYTTTPGTADIWQFSVLSDDDIKLLQSGTTVTLGSMSFIALASGTSQLAFDTLSQTVSGALDTTPPPDGPLATLLTVETQSGSVTINSGQNTPVPEPTTLLLIFVGLSGLVLQRRR